MIRQRVRRPLQDRPVYVTASDAGGRVLALVSLLIIDHVAAGRGAIASVILVTSGVFLLLPVLNLGTSLVVVRLVGGALRAGDRRRAESLCRRSLVMAVGVGMLVTALGATGPATTLLGHALPVPVDRTSAALVGAWLGTEIVRNAVADALRAMRRYLRHAIAGHGGRSLAVLAVLGVLVLRSNELTFDQLVIAQVLGNVACTVVGGLAVLGWAVRRHGHGGTGGWTELVGPGMHLVPTAMANWFLTQGDIWVVGTLLGSGSIATYGLAVRFAALCAMPLALTTNTVAPMLAELADDRAAEERFLRGAAALSGGLALVGYVAVLALGALVGDAVLGPSGEDALPLFAILALGQVVNAATGQVFPTMVIHHRERQLAVITAVIAVVALAGQIVAGSIAEGVGVAVVSAGATAALNVACYRACRSGLGLSLAPAPRAIRGAVRLVLARAAPTPE